MSSAQSEAFTNAPIDPPETPLPALTAKHGRSFWQIVSRSYFRRIKNQIATAYVVLLAVVAVIAPFIANGRPYTAVVDGKRVWPLFRMLSREDRIVLLAGVGFLLYLAVRFFTRKRPPETRTPVRRIALLILVVLGLVASGGIMWSMRHGDNNDLMTREDYKGITPDYDVQGAVFPPLSWGFQDSIYPQSPETQFADPSKEHWLGTDESSRDTLARLLWATRVVFGIGLISELISLAIGIVYGAFMGYFGGTVDILGSRFIELVESIPTLFLIITLVALLGREIYLIMIVLGLTGWTSIARFVRAEFYRLRKMDFVAAAHATGVPLTSILFRHMLPNGLTPILVNATFGIAGAVTIESSLSYLGLGVQPPRASWGSMLNAAGSPGGIFHFWAALAPGIMIFFTIFAYNIIGEGFRDAIDPRLNRLE